MWRASGSTAHARRPGRVMIRAPAASQHCTKHTQPSEEQCVSTLARLGLRAASHYQSAVPEQRWIQIVDPPPAYTQQYDIVTPCKQRHCPCARNGASGAWAPGINPAPALHVHVSRSSGTHVALRSHSCFPDPAAATRHHDSWQLPRRHASKGADESARPQLPVQRQQPGTLNAILARNDVLRKPSTCWLHLTGQYHHPAPNASGPQAAANRQPAFHNPHFLPTCTQAYLLVSVHPGQTPGHTALHAPMPPLPFPPCNPCPPLPAPQTVAAPSRYPATPTAPPAAPRRAAAVSPAP